MDRDILERLREAATILVETDGVGDIGVLEAARIEIERLQAELAETEKFMFLAMERAKAAEAERAWRDIETAPKNGTQVWGWNGHDMETIIWAGDPPSWLVTWSDADFLPTYWQPLPAPPTAGEP